MQDGESRGTPRVRTCRGGSDASRYRAKPTLSSAIPILELEGCAGHFIHLF